MSDERHDAIRELLGVYALDAVDEREAELVEAHLATCVECSTEVAHHHEVAAMLANTGGEAPSHLWHRIEARLRPTPESTTPAIVELDARHAGRHRLATSDGQRGGALRWVASIAAVIVLGGFIAEVVNLEGRVNQLQGASAQAEVTRAAQTAIRDPAARKVDLVSSSATRLAQIAIMPSGAAYLLDDALPALPASRTYQLWAEVGDHLVSMGLLGSHPSAIAFEVGQAKISSFAITDEREGGVVAPTRAPIATTTT
jgi:hypothetical protein